ncbi:MAG: hypothetical protein ACR2I0_01225, partial [Rhodoferax sp.]
TIIDTATVSSAGTVTFAKLQQKLTGTGTAPNKACTTGNSGTEVDIASTGTSAAISDVQPGDCVIYQVKFTNTTTQNVTNLTVSDGYDSNYAAVVGTASCAATGVVDTSNASTTDYASATTSTLGAVKCAPNTAPTASTNSIIPGGTLTLHYAVQIKQQ